MPMSWSKSVIETLSSEDRATIPNIGSWTRRLKAAIDLGLITGSGDGGGIGSTWAYDFRLETAGGPVPSIVDVKAGTFDLELVGGETTLRATDGGANAWAQLTEGEAGQDMEVVSLCGHSDGSSLSRTRQGVGVRSETTQPAAALRRVDDTIRIFEGSSLLVSETAPTVAPNAWVYMRARAFGSNLSAKYWLSTESEPVGWQITSAITATEGRPALATQHAVSGFEESYWRWVGVSMNPESEAAPLPGEVTPINA